MGPSQVLVAPVEQRAVQRTQPLVASVEPVTRSTLAAEEAGLVAERHFDEGQRVRKGELLARTRTDLLEMQLTAATAVRATTQAMLERAEAVADHAARELARIRKMQSQGVGSEKEINDAINADRVGKALVAAGKAELAEKDAEVGRLKLLIDKSQVHSPFEGVIERRHVEVGQWIKQGDPVAELVQLDPLFVRVYVPEGVVSRIKVGDSATVTFDALGGADASGVTGKIEQILPTADPSSRTFPVKILLPNPELKIWPGFFARAMITSRSQGEGFLVPRDAVVTGGGRHHVVAARDGKAVVVPVKLGTGAGDKVVVSGELGDKDVVVIRGNEALRGGEQLIVLNPPAAPAAAGAPTTRPAAATGATAHGN
jgi:RND family efflux transporter MFP subunit